MLGDTRNNMSVLTVVKHYDELSINELYRIIQLRVQGFIVRNKVCYQDLEAHYDKNSYWCMNYDTVLGLEPQNMIGTISWCLNKVFTGEDGREYRYPAARRQACMDEYKGGMSIYDFKQGGKFLDKKLGTPHRMLEITYEKGRQIFFDLGCREVGTNIDPAGRKNWVFVMDEEAPGWENETTRSD